MSNINSLNSVRKYLLALSSSSCIYCDHSPNKYNKLAKPKSLDTSVTVMVIHFKISDLASSNIISDNSLVICDRFFLILFYSFFNFDLFISF